MKKIVWFLSLILCMATFVIAPPAQAMDQALIVKNVSEFKVQGGEITSTSNSVIPNQWTLLSGTGERKFTTHVDFKEPYKQPPVVVVSISGMDVRTSANNRLVVTSKNVTASGFDVECKTWGDSQIWSVFLNWTAFGGKS
ncbi:MAG TPA: hypothetical protein DEG17_16560 [Cyanobacteria bacterium UBA11149]|nr:hypothetical protein [Cyanobacteria bacterium UBA11367]HBE59911.1 hypothetical protein [Cyanobacteria bacterium UBA11366]HBK64706.1 hypothetical protein [Cyanobacteria bacterium UBA11166]HBR75867.1 hypothetical protein [Cyanobacteria bacterium UBA11159]HBS69289.1 hypothetical protein [Cyanobacteria bacterium UBA11153]HBW90434.1 hypothetical protein [Cyanobacteria bacterium UBA11149]HCA96644.1 hypothetical protein [Cyanobacteria bacterium UBA9226]